MERIDSFGRQISILLKRQSSYQTKFGSILTISIFIVLVIRFILMIKNVKQGNDPVVLFQERKTDFIKRFDINPQTFNLGLTIQDKNYNYLSIENVLNVEAYLEVKTVVENKDTKEPSQKWDRIYFQLEQCTDDHLQIKDAYKIFQQTTIQKSYCFPKNIPLYIEGEFNSDYFAQIVINFKKCKNPSCYDDAYFKENIKALFLGIQFSDVYFSPENRDNPFTFYGRDVFWSLSKNYQKQVYMELRNNYVETDFGLFNSDIKTDIYPSFQRSTEFITDIENDVQSAFVLRFEKIKENLYKRSYLKVLQIISEIGGFSSVLSTVGIVLAVFYTKIHLYEHLINNTFTFKEQTENQISSVNQENLQLKTVKNFRQTKLNRSQDITQKYIKKGETQVSPKVDMECNSTDKIYKSNEKLHTMKKNEDIILSQCIFYN